MTKRRNLFCKLKIFLFGKDIRVTKGEPYTEIRPFDFSSYYPEEKYIKKEALPKENYLDIRDFGAIPNHPEIDNANSINQAIEEAAKTGAIVLIDGGAYTSTTVFLHSNITIFLAYGSSIIANTTGIGYSHRALLYGEAIENITITGGGKICGNGNFFGRKPILSANQTEPPEVIDVVQMRQDYRKQLRFAHESKYGSPVILKKCKNVVLHNFIIENSASWSLRLDQCENVDIHDFIINNNRNVANADGIDLMGSSHAKVRRGFISTADDGIVIKNALWEGSNTPLCDIEISNLEIISRTNSIKVGTETTHDIHDIRISDCKCFMTDLYPGTVSAISLETVDGAVLSHVHIKNIETNRCSCPLFLRLGNRNRAAQVNSLNARAIEFGQKRKKGASANKKEFAHKGEMKDIVIENLRANEMEIPIIICGYKQNGKTKRIKNITLKHINLHFSNRPFVIDRRLFIPEYAREYPEANRFRNLPSYALFLRHVENIHIQDFQTNIPKTKKKAMVKKDVKNAVFESFPA